MVTYPLALVSVAEAKDYTKSEKQEENLRGRGE